MAKYSKEELTALGAKLDAVQLTDREREILGRVFTAVSGGETDGFGSMNDEELDAVVGGASVSKDFGSMLSKLDLGSKWTRGSIAAADGQWADSPKWNNSAAVRF